MESQLTDRLEKYHNVRTRIHYCKVRLLKSEVETQARITRWRAKLQMKTMEHLHKAEEIMLNDLRRIVSEQEMEIDKIDEEAGERIGNGDFCDDKVLQHKMVRFEPDESLQILQESSLRFGTLHIEDVTETQMCTSLRGIYLNEEAEIYTEIPSLTDCTSLSSDQMCRTEEDDFYIHPVHGACAEKRSAESTSPAHKVHVHIEKETKTPEREICDDTAELNDNSISNDCTNLPEDNSNGCTQGQPIYSLAKPIYSLAKPIYSLAKLKRTPSVETIQLFGGESVPQGRNKSDTEHMISTVDRACNNRKTLSSNVDNLQEHLTIKEWKTFHPSVEHELHSLNPKAECQDATPKVAREKIDGGPNSQNIDTEALQCQSSKRKLRKSPELCQRDMDSCRLAILPDGRLVLLCESAESLMLYDENYQYVASMSMKWPKVICNATDNHVLVVQLEDHNETVISVEAKADYMNAVDGRRFSCKGRIFDITFRDLNVYLGCNEGHLHVWNEAFEEVSMVTIENETLRFPCISLDYNPVSETLYIVSSNGDLSVLERMDPVKTTCARTLAVCCLDGKAYLLCCEEKYHVVVEICPEGETIKKREVIRIAKSNTSDMSISPKGEYLLLLHSDRMTLSIKKYSIHRHA